MFDQDKLERSDNDSSQYDKSRNNVQYFQFDLMVILVLYRCLSVYFLSV